MLKLGYVSCGVVLNMFVVFRECNLKRVLCCCCLNCFFCVCVLVMCFCVLGGICFLDGVFCDVVSFLSVGFEDG